jgi:hypothetical protein
LLCEETNDYIQKKKKKPNKQTYRVTYLAKS